ncbi:tyrosine-type recombinase/integrase [Evansella sp. AB-rgal1]|uniref:tyrosine-type recombinase/integrase n=1 Tax=Evansella sp. AB-rgal1 TaxID=3242696 RepID=UPI00359EC802
MDYLHKEIETYSLCSKNSKRTIDRYQKHLINFGYFLAEVIEEEYEKVHLERIYKRTDVMGRLIMYLPINAEIIDDYFYSNIEMGYSWLRLSRASLGSFFKYLLKNYDFRNIIKEIDFVLSDYKHLKVPTRILNRHDIIKFLQSIVKYSENLKRDLLFFTLLLSTGCRINELLKIQVRDIDLNNDTAYLRTTKNKRSHILVLRNELGQLIYKYCDEQNIKRSDLLFYDVPYHDANKLLSNYLEYAGITKVTIHSLRHSFATMLYESGAAITTIQQLLNHVALSSTKEYVEPNYIRNTQIEIPQNLEIYKNLSCLKNL